MPNTHPNKISLPNLESESADTHPKLVQSLESRPAAREWAMSIAVRLFAQIFEWQRLGKFDRRWFDTRVPAARSSAHRRSRRKMCNRLANAHRIARQACLVVDKA